MTIQWQKGFISEKSKTIMSVSGAIVMEKFLPSNAGGSQNESALESFGYCQAN